MAGCFSGLFKVKEGSRSQQRTHFNQMDNNTSTSTGEKENTDGQGKLNPTAPCVCIPPAGAPSLFDSPPAYTPDSAREIFRPEVLEFIDESVDGHSDELQKLSLSIHDNPELRFEEWKTHDTMSNFMESHGIQVERHYLMETAWRADFSHGEGGRVLGVNSEMDALPGIGHACGHNLIAVCGVGVALAVKDALKKFDIPGKIVLLGTPAEEGGGGKVILIEKGGYKGMDACVMSHPGPGPDNAIGIGTSLATQAIKVEFLGHTAHAAIAPWKGRNSLDAAVIAYSSVGVLRQQIRPDYRVHDIIEGRDWAPQVIPDYARMDWFVRAPTAGEAQVLRERVDACFEAAAKATATEAKISTSSPSYHDLRQNSVLGNKSFHTIAPIVERHQHRISEMFACRGMPDLLMGASIGGSTDFGNVTYEMPAIHPVYTIPTVPNGGNHTIEFTESSRTEEAHVQTLKVVKGLAHTGFRVLDDDKFFKKAKAAFDEDMKRKDF